MPVFLKIKKFKKKSRSGRKIGAVGDDKQLIFFTRPYAEGGSLVDDCVYACMSQAWVCVRARMWMYVCASMRAWHMCVRVRVCQVCMCLMVQVFC